MKDEVGLMFFLFSLPHITSILRILSAIYESDLLSSTLETCVYICTTLASHTYPPVCPCNVMLRWKASSMTHKTMQLATRLSESPLNKTNSNIADSGPKGVDNFRLFAFS